MLFVTTCSARRNRALNFSCRRAQQFGVKTGTIVTASTANGLARGVRNDTLRITIEGIDQGTPEIWYMPRLADAILGQNILKNFNIEVNGDKMTFRSHLP